MVLHDHAHIEVSARAERKVSASAAQTLVKRARGWMLLLPVDALAMALPAVWRPEQLKAIVVMAALSVLTIAGDRGYRAKLTVSFMDELPVLMRNILTPIALVAIVVALRHEPVSLSWFLQSALWSVLFLLVGRSLTMGAISWSRRKGITAHRTVVLGANPLSAELIETLLERPQHGLSLVGYVGAQDLDDAIPLSRIGNVGDLADVVVTHDVEVVVIADGGTSGREVVLALEDSRIRQCDVYVVPTLSHLRASTGHHDHISSIPVVRLGQTTLDGPAMVAKRLFDVAVAGASLILLSPLMLILAAGVRRTGEQVLFRQQRVGRDGVLFDCLKFRSMRPATPEEMATTWSGSEEHRMTAFGRVMRKLSLDELPQLWNVVRGDMSLVGPRPERPHFVEQFSLRYDLYPRRHRVRSGLTGLAQVSGLRGDTSIGIRARYDNYYIENWTLWLDAKILLRTVAEVVLARGA